MSNHRGQSGVEKWNTYAERLLSYIFKIKYSDSWLIFKLRKLHDDGFEAQLATFSQKFIMVLFVCIKEGTIGQSKAEKSHSHVKKFQKCLRKC